MIPGWPLNEHLLQGMKMALLQAQWGKVDVNLA